MGLLNLHKSLQREIIQHALGIETKVMKECIPKDKKSNCIFVSRLFVFLWSLIIIFSIYVNSFLPIFLLLILLSSFLLFFLS